MTQLAQYIFLNGQHGFENIGIGSTLIFIIKCIYTYIISIHSNEIKAMKQKAKDIVMVKLQLILTS